MSQNTAHGLNHTIQEYIKLLNVQIEHTVLQCGDIFRLYLLNREIYFHRPPCVHLHADDWRWVWLPHTLLLSSPPHLSQPGHGFVSLGSTKHHGTTLSLKGVFVLFGHTLVVTPARVIFTILLKRCTCKLWCCCRLSEWCPAEAPVSSRGRLWPHGTWHLREGIPMKWIRAKRAVQQSAREPVWLTVSWVAVRPITEGTAIEATARKLWARWWRHFHPPGGSSQMVVWKRAVGGAHKSIYLQKKSHTYNVVTCLLGWYFSGRTIHLPAECWPCTDFSCIMH